MADVSIVEMIGRRLKKGGPSDEPDTGHDMPDGLRLAAHDIMDAFGERDADALCEAFCRFLDEYKAGDE